MEKEQEGCSGTKGQAVIKLGLELLSDSQPIHQENSHKNFVVSSEADQES